MTNKTSLPFSLSSRLGSAVYVSGQVGLDPVSGAVVGPTLEEQTVQTMRNIQSILKGEGLDFSDVKKVSVYLTKREFFETFNEIYIRFFKEPYPARTTIYCDLNYDLLVEIDVVAELRENA
ncbi:RidA family protein [Paenibacillus sp. J5C_2022]|uniref:RidA family protein n=1 Tax=Paenibacillus sp. J5C2022 TaxID=2977129 RepID=UPI0021D17273|nr:RidA family protein [Paenibacillus sp. J5C2022]MCU6709586.1 RidA family protein [Paenibacillus sp. J5C2022]